MVCPRNPRQELSQCLHQLLIRLLGRLSSSSLIWPEAIWTVMYASLFGSFGRFLNEVAPAESVAQTRPPVKLRMSIGSGEKSGPRRRGNG